MGRNRVLSFMSQFSGSSNQQQQQARDAKTPTPTSSPPHHVNLHDSSSSSPSPFAFAHHQHPQKPAEQPYVQRRPETPPPSASPPAAHPYLQDNNGESPNRSPVTDSPQRRSSSRPLSMVQTYQPPLMDVGEDTIPELQPIFTFLNSHANKLYQEGYFLKLDDQNSQGKPNPDRTWTECFAQLVGTVLSLWDAAELDAAGEDGEVLPKFINLTDASIKMIESLPTRSNEEQPLQNILSISTAGRNRYLLHFNSHHSLIQWTAGIRLAMFEHSTLQEAYTGALIAGKAKSLNNINVIMDRTRFKVEEWVRVRFGAGVPWRRCWCVISPPDEKEFQKMQKDMKKRSPYDRSPMPLLKGDIKFYDTKKDGKKQKKARPIASISDAYSAYAIYPQAKSLIDASTLVKIEGNITIHSEPPSSTEGFVFVMPETHPAVSGFEMLLRFLFPTWDTFGLYGRPGRLVASVLDPRSLMFAMPKHRRYGYLEILDVSGLILSEGSGTWQEREWRRRLKDLTGRRMNAVEDGSKGHSRTNSRKSNRLSVGHFPPAAAQAKPRVNFAEDGGSPRSSRSMSIMSPGMRTDSAPPAADRERAPSAMADAQVHAHARNTSDPHMVGHAPPRQHDQPMYDDRYTPSPQPGFTPVRGMMRDESRRPGERISSEDERSARNTPVRELEDMRSLQTPEPVQTPPQFNHGPQSRPGQKAYHSPELRRANSRLSSTTLAQMAKAGGMAVPTNDGYMDGSADGRRSAEHGAGSGSVQPYANPSVAAANVSGSREALPSSHAPRSSPGLPPPDLGLARTRSKSPLRQQPYGPSSPQPRGPSPASGRAPTPETGGPVYEYAQPSSNRPAQPAQPQNYVNYRGVQQGPPQRMVTPPEGTAQYVGYRPEPTSPPASQRDSLPHLNTSPPIHRKPLPQRASSLQKKEEDTPVSSSSAGSYGNGLIDQAAFEQIHPQDPLRQRTPLPEPRVHRQDSERSGASSHYDDAASTASPDYASTRESSETHHSMDRPRAGVLKTVGGGEPPMPTKPSEFNVPEINFGRTINYGATPGPRSKTPTGLPPLGPIPAASHQRPYSPARKSPVPDLGHMRQDSDDTIRRTAPWQPGGSTPGSSSAGGVSGSVTPEQFVQQRAAAVAGPQYSHSRTPSGNALVTISPATPSPLLSKKGSQDMLRHSRNNSADLLHQRPGSQGAGSVLAGAGSGDKSSRLSAREQEHVARVTGSPLINMAGNRNPSSGGGLFGAIEAREREKQQIKQGLNNQAVQHAINQRQQQQAQAAFQQQAQQTQQAQSMAYQQHMAWQQAYQQQQQQAMLQHQQQPHLQPQQAASAMQNPYTAPSPNPYGSPTSLYGGPAMRPGNGPSQQSFTGQPQGQYSPGSQPQPQQQQGRGGGGGFHGQAF